MNKAFGMTLAAALMLGACSSKPRQFRPVLAAAPADAVAYEADYEECRAQIASRLDAKGRLASGAVGVAAGVGAGAVGAAATSGTYATVGGAMAAGGAVIMAMPLAGVLGAWGLAKAKKGRKERAIKEATASCLQAKGYAVEAWSVQKTGRGRVAARTQS
jgi:hypothetical protein